MSFLEKLIYGMPGEKAAGSGPIDLNSMFSGIFLDVIFFDICILDVSGSMTEKDSEGNTRLHGVINAFKRFITVRAECLRESTVEERAGCFNLISFNTSAGLVSGIVPYNSGEEEALSSLDELCANGGTNYLPPLAMTRDIVKRVVVNDVPVVFTVLFLSDGAPYDGPGAVKYCESMIDDGIYVATAGIGSEGCSRYLEKMASEVVIDNEPQKLFRFCKDAEELARFFSFVGCYLREAD